MTERPQDLKRKNIWFPPEKWGALKTQALKTGLSPSELVGELLDEYLADLPQHSGEEVR